MGGFKLVTNGLSSRHGEVSLEEAVDEPPGDSIDRLLLEESSKKINNLIILFNLNFQSLIVSIFKQINRL